MGVPQEAMSTMCICMDTQNGKLLNTSQTQNFDIFGRVINNDTKMIKPMRKCRVTGHIREIKSNEITRGKNCKTGLNLIKCQNSG